MLIINEITLHSLSSKLECHLNFDYYEVYNNKINICL